MRLKTLLNTGHPRTSLKLGFIVAGFAAPLLFFSAYAPFHTLRRSQFGLYGIGITMVVMAGIVLVSPVCFVGPRMTVRVISSFRCSTRRDGTSR